MTATQALYLLGNYRPSQTVLWHAGASSVSIAGIQLSKANNAGAVYVTAGSSDKIDFCVHEVGATAGFNYKTQDWAAEIEKLTSGNGVDLVIDFVGATHFQGNLDTAAKDGHIVELGLMSGSKLPAGVDISGLLRKRLTLQGSTLRSRDESYQRRLRDIFVQRSLPNFVDGTFKLFMERIFPAEEISAAHKLLESNVSRGKVVCTFDWQPGDERP